MTQVPTTSIPYNGSGTINIHVTNPTASLGGAMPAYSAPQYIYYPVFTYPPEYYLKSFPQSGQNQTTNVNLGNGNNTVSQNDNNGNNKKNINETNIIKHTETTTKTSSDEDKKEREIIVLTDNYIKTLENYLRSNNTQLRKDAIKEVLMRFKEDKSRIENPSLTALLNLALQDYNSTVRSIAMTALQSGYAKGDRHTERILKELQKQDSNFNTDATQATDSLLQMSKVKKMVADNSHQSPNISKHKKKGDNNVI